MPISAKILDVGASLEQIRQEFNNLQSDVNILQQSPTYGDSLIFEGATSDAYETTLSVQDPTADRTVLLPNETGTLLTSGATINATTSAITANNSTNETVYILFADGASGNQGLESDTSLTYNPSTNLLTTGSLVIADAGNIGSASDTDAISISSGGAIQLTQTLDVAGDLTALTLNADGDTAAGDNAAIGYTAAEGLILTGQGSTSDITLKNDADGTVFTVPTGTDDILFPDGAKAMWGAGSDFAIFHDGSNTYLAEQGDGTGQVYLRANSIELLNNSNETYAKFLTDGAVELYYDNTKHLETVSGGGTLTGSWAVTTSLNPDASDGATLGTTALEWSDLYLADGAVIGFGDDQDVTFTHIADTGLLLSGSRQFQFGDSGTYIHQSADGVLDLVSDTEIEINATTIDINGNVEISGTTAQVGVATFTARDIHSGGITIANDGQIGSAGDADAMAISSSGVVTFTQAPVFNNGATLTGSLGVGTAMNPDASDGATLGTTALEWSDLYLADGAQILFGDDQEVTLTHVADTGLLLNSTMKLQFNDASQYIQGASATVLDIAATDEIELNATLVDVNANLDVSGTYTGAGLMTTGGNIIIPNAGNIGSVGDTDSLAIDSSGNVTASQNLTVTGNLTVNGTTTTVATSNTIIGDSLIELNNGAGSNSNDLGIVMERGSTGDNAIIAWDESADKFTMGTTTATGASTGNLTITAGTLVVSALEGTLSTAAQTNITSLGTLTALTVDNVAINGTTIGHTGDTDLMTLASGVLTVAGRLDVADAIYLTGDEKAIRFYNGSNYVELVAHGSTSANTTFKLPQADGSSGQAMVTDASGNLSFAANNVGNATSFTTVANNSTDETTFVVFVDGATGEQGPETDTALTYNPSTGLLSSAALTLTGALTVGGTTTLNGNLVLGDAAADTLTVGATLQGASPLTFEGGTADGNETTFAITDPTADRTITFPDATGTVILSGGTLSGSTITATTAFVPDASDGAALGTSSLEFSDLFLADGAVINFGDDQDVTLTHVADTGLRLTDGYKMIWGAGNDFTIHHSGSNTFLDESGTGELQIRSDGTIAIKKQSADETMASFAGDGAVTLYHNNVAKIATSSTGVSVTGNVVATGEATFGPGGTGTDVVNIIADGGSGAAGGSTFEVRSNGTFRGGLGNKAALAGSGTSTDLELRAASSIPITFAPNNTNALTLDTSGNATFAGRILTDDATEATSTTDGSLQTDGGLSVVKDAVFGDDVKLLSDAAVLAFGADGDVTVTHVADTGILLNSTREIQFRDSALKIYSSTDGQLDLAADTEIELTSTTVAVEGIFNVSGTSWFYDDVQFRHDGVVLNFGADGDVTLTHVADTGLLLNSTRQIQFNDASQYICGATATQLDIRATDEIELTATLVDLNGNLDVSGTIVGASTLSATTITASTAVVPDASDGAALGTTSLEWSDLFLADGATIKFGDDQDVVLTHVADSGIRLSDSDKMLFGDGNDLEIYHDGSDSHIKDTGTGDLYISASDDIVLRTKAGAETALIANDDGAVELYYDNAKKLETSSAGGTLTGVWVTSANITDATIVAGDLADGAVNSAKILNGTIVSADLADNAVSTAKIAADAITAAKIADDVINSEHIVADSIDAEHYAAGSVDATALGADCVTAAKIGDNVINSEHYAADSIDEEHLANDCVGSAELKSLSTLLIKNSSGSTLKTVHGAGA